MSTQNDWDFQDNRTWAPGSIPCFLGVCALPTGSESFGFSLLVDGNFIGLGGSEFPVSASISFWGKLTLYGRLRTLDPWNLLLEAGTEQCMPKD